MQKTITAILDLFALAILTVLVRQWGHGATALVVWQGAWLFSVLLEKVTWTLGPVGLLRLIFRGLYHELMRTYHDGLLDKTDKLIERIHAETPQLTEGTPYRVDSEDRSELLLMDLTTVSEQLETHADPSTPLSPINSRYFQKEMHPEEFLRQVEAKSPLDGDPVPSLGP